MLLDFGNGAGGDEPDLVNSVCLVLLWRQGGQCCAVVLSGFGWDRVSSGTGLYRSG